MSASEATKVFCTLIRRKKLETGGENDRLKRMFQVVARHEACRSGELRFEGLPLDRAGALQMVAGGGR